MSETAPTYGSRAIDDKFSIAECDILIQALEAWEHKDSAGRLMGGIIGALVTRTDDPIARTKFEQDEIRREKEYEQKMLERRDISLLLKAKLVQMKQSIKLRGDLPSGI